MSRRLLLVLALGLFSLPLRLAAAGLKAIAVTVEQPAKFSKDGIKYRKLKAGTPLYGGDVLRTGETGRVVIRFVDGSQAAVASNTDVALRRLTPQEDPIKTTLSLLRGSLRALIHKLSARSSFEVETYNTVVAVKGTDFAVDVVTDKDGHKKTVAACFETQGKGLEVSGLDGSDVVIVGAGQKTLNLTGKPEQPSVLNATDLQKALEKYRALTLSAVPTPVPGQAQVTPVPLPPAAAAAQAAAENAFNAAARQSEAALGSYLNAVDTNDQAAQAQLQQQLQGLRDAAQNLEEQLVDREQQLEQQIQEQQAHPDNADAGPDPVLQAQLQEVQQLQQTLREVTLQAHLETQADASQGNLLMDKDGFRTQVSTQIQRGSTDVAGDSIHWITLSQRSDGPNSGRTEFQHLVVFNQGLPDDWVSIYKRPLNDPLNLSGGTPGFYRTEDIQKTFSPSGDCVCLEQDLDTPQLDGGANTFRQARQEFYQAIGAAGGIAQGERSYDYLGVLQVATSDNIQITATDTGSTLHLSYDNLGGPTGFIGNIFTLDVSLPGSGLDAASFGNSLFELATANLSSIGASTGIELTFRSDVAYPGHQVSPLLDKESFVDAFSQLGR